MFEAIKGMFSGVRCPNIPYQAALLTLSPPSPSFYILILFTSSATHAHEPLHPFTSPLPHDLHCLHLFISSFLPHTHHHLLPLLSSPLLSTSLHPFLPSTSPSPSSPSPFIPFTISYLHNTHHHLHPFISTFSPHPLHHLQPFTSSSLPHVHHLVLPFTSSLQLVHHPFHPQIPICPSLQLPSPSQQSLLFHHSHPHITHGSFTLTYTYSHTPLHPFIMTLTNTLNGSLTPPHPPLPLPAPSSPNALFSPYAKEVFRFH